MSTFRIREYDHQERKWQQRRFQVGVFKDKKNAQKACKKIAKKVNERNNTDPKKLFALITFKEFTETYWKDYTVRENFQPSTLYARHSLLKNHLLPAFGVMKLRDVKPADISNFMNGLYRDNYTGGTILALYSFLKLIFTLAKQHDLIKKSLVRNKRHRPKVAKSKKPTLTSKQIGEVIRYLSNANERTMALLLALTGMRVGEALALRWQDFNAATGQLTINHTLYRLTIKKPKTTESVATLQLEPPVAELLREHYRQSDFQQPKDFTFCRPGGLPLCYTACAKRLHKAMDKAGIEQQRGTHGFHIFRHTAGSLAYSKSRDLKAVQNLLRHSNLSTTADIYIHAEDEIVSGQLGHLAGEIMPNCDLTVTEESESVN